MFAMPGVWDRVARIASALAGERTTVHRGQHESRWEAAEMENETTDAVTGGLLVFGAISISVALGYLFRPEYGWLCIGLLALAAGILGARK